ncbi:MAG: hypothetical protein ABSF50_03400 [Burkholderiaceae bacterium]|jgi:hypothetical protein
MGPRLIWILWPAFVVSGAACGVFFSIVDPVDLVLFGHQLQLSRMGAYTTGFFGFWGIGALSSAMTVLLSQSPWEVNRCPVPLSERACQFKPSSSDEAPGGVG